MKANVEELLGNLAQDMRMAEERPMGIWWSDTRANQTRTEAWELLAGSGLFQVSRKDKTVTLRFRRTPHLKVVK